MDTLGFVGLGNMGAGMAINLLRGGYQLVVRDVRSEPIGRLKSAGATAGHSNFDVGAASQCAFVAVFDGETVLSVCLGDSTDGGLLAGMREGATIIVHSTVGPEVIRRLTDEATSRGIRVVDAPMTGGGHEAAEAGSLTFFVGGTVDAVSSVAPYLELMGSHVFHVGPTGSGIVLKVLSNFLSIGNTLLVNEALALAHTYDLDSGNVLSMIEAGGVGASWVSTHWEQITTQERTYTIHGGMAELARKDLGLATAFAVESGSEVPILRFLEERVAPQLKTLTYDG
jgi:3-hydroxyisobutyrate dehydrogenase-like beta-hydroxyacid dehydrogenase